MKKSVLWFKSNKMLGQSVGLFAATVLSMFSIIFGNYYLTRLLDPVQFGNYSFLINVFSFSQVIFNFGFLQSICRLIALSDDKEECREYYSVGLLLSFLLFILMFVSLILYAFFSENIKSNNLFFTFILIIPFGWVYLLTNFNELILQGSNDILLLSESRLLPRVIFLVVLLLIYGYKINVGINTLLLFYFLSYAIVYIYVIWKLKPLFRNVKNRIVQVWKANNSYGFHIYIGSIFAVGVSSLVSVLISYFEKDNAPVGFYNIALQLSTPLTLVPNIMATVMFKKFAVQPQISKKMVSFMFLVSLLVMVVILLIAKPLIMIIYGEQYVESVNLVNLLTFGSLLYGVADFYNRFLLSKGRGAELRNASIVVGIILFVSSILLISSFGVDGAAYSKIISGFFYILTMLFFYKKVKVSGY
ncbi:oligosaccharide flippase family protein [Bacteroides sp.]